MITWLCDQIRQYYISVFTAAGKPGGSEGTGRTPFALGLSFPDVQQLFPKPVITFLQKQPFVTF